MTVAPDADNEEISLLDLLVAVAENWLLIVCAPVLLGILGAAVLWFTAPSQFESEALLRISAEDSVMLRSARVLDTPQLNNALSVYYGGPLSTARARFVEERLGIAKLQDPDLYRVTVRAGSPNDAHLLLTTIIGSLVDNSVPTPLQQQRMELRRGQVETSLDELESSLDRLNRLADNSLATDRTLADIALGELGQSIVAILGNIESRRLELFNIEQALVGSVTQDDIIQPPTLPDGALSRGLVTPVMLIIVGTGFLMIIVAFIRTGFRNARSKETVDKINRIRRAFWLKPVDPTQ